MFPKANKLVDDFPKLRDFLQDHLLNWVMPFWTKYAIDEEGGLNTCIRDDGTVISRDKWLWSQWRAVWVFSKLYNQIKPQQEWFDLARNIYELSSKWGWDEAIEGWRLCLTHDGRTIRGCDSIYVDAFAIYGLTELAKVFQRDKLLDLAKRTANSALKRLDLPHHEIPIWLGQVPPGSRLHALPMIFSLALWELGQLADDDRYRSAAVEMADDVMANFYRPDRDLVLEYIADDNSEYPPPFGTTVVPIHVVEGMWFQIHIARDRGDTRRVQEACRLIERHVAVAWDDQYGGLLHAIDISGRNDVGVQHPESKMWWAHTEAMYALLLAYEHTKKKVLLDWYARIHDYSFTHYPVEIYGEWTQKLDRYGKKYSEDVSSTIALPVKDPFHLPRALIYCIDVLNRLIDASESGMTHHDAEARPT